MGVRIVRYGYVLLACLVGVGAVLLGGWGVMAAPAQPDPPPQPMPHDCDGVTPPGQPLPLCCLRGYVYWDGTPALGALVRVESPHGVLTTTTITDSFGRISYRASLSDTPLLAQVGDWITVTGWLSGGVATKTYQVTPHGQQVDLVLRSWDDWWNPEWKYRRRLSLRTGAGHPVGFLFRLEGLGQPDHLGFDDLVQAGKALSDYRDIRLIHHPSSGEPLEVARNISSSFDLEFKFPVPTAPDPEDSYYLYYGNPAAGPAPTFTPPEQGFWVDLCSGIYCDGGVLQTIVLTNTTIDFSNVCDPPVDHDGRVGSGTNQANRYRGMIYIPSTGQWTFRLYLGDGYQVRIDRSVIGWNDSPYGAARWVTVNPSTTFLTQGWHLLQLDHKWVNCTAMKLAMSGPNFPEQIVPASYFRQAWEIEWGLSSGGETAFYTSGLPVPTIHTVYPRPAVQDGTVITMIGSGVDNDERGESIQSYRWRINAMLKYGSLVTWSGSSLPLGLQDVYFSVQDDEGDWSQEISTSLMVYVQNPPVAAFTVTQASETVSNVFRLDASSSRDVEDGVAGLQVRWDFEDNGTFDTAWSTTKVLTHDYNYLGPGVYSTRLEVKDSGGLTGTMVQSITVSSPYSITPWLFILYLDGDNNLSINFQSALARLSQMPANPAVTIVALVDSYGSGSTKRYRIQPGGYYLEGINQWTLPEADMGNPQTLSDFVTWARENYPAQHIYLAIADHGRGTTGLAWDITSGNDVFIDVQELRQALQTASNNGTTPLDVVHYDACLMGMVENAYQVKDYARFLVASQNLGWSLFPYERYGARVTHATLPISLAQIVVDEYDRGLPSHPHTLSALDLRKAAAVATAVTTLSLALQPNVSIYQEAISLTLAGTQKFDSRDYFILNDLDEYVDLWDLANGLEGRILSSTVQAAARGVKTAVEELVIAERHTSGSYQEYDWDLSGAHGVSIYFPPVRDGWEYQNYVEENIFTFTANGQWDEFLTTYLSLGSTIPITPTNPGVPPTLLPQYWIYLPIVIQR